MNQKEWYGYQGLKVQGRVMRDGEDAKAVRASRGPSRKFNIGLEEEEASYQSMYLV